MLIEQSSVARVYSGICQEVTRLRSAKVGAKVTRTREHRKHILKKRGNTEERAQQQVYYLGIKVGKVAVWVADLPHERVRERQHLRVLSESKRAHERAVRSAQRRGKADGHK